nr:hypothetical protein BaRGS_029628 [Batillaria attramentaria]
MDAKVLKSSLAVVSLKVLLCLVPVKVARDWVGAQSACERGGGDLYRLNADYLLTSSSELASCLRAIPSVDNLGDDFWIGAVSAWSRHWFWINETLLNPIQYVTGNVSALSEPEFEVCSNYLSVDYCVFVCRDNAAVYTALHFRTASFCCFCSFFLMDDLVRPAGELSFFRPDRTSFYVAPAREGNLIRLAASDTFSDTETLCAIVDSTTYETECRAAGGDLWQLGTLDDMKQVSDYIVPNAPYWIGATDHFWYFSAASYPIIPIIAACIAALAILLCAIFVLGYSRRRKWLVEKWKKTRDYMWPFWASTPTTYLHPDHTSDRGFDSLSTGHTGLHGSDSGSVFAAAAFVYPDAYKTRSRTQRSSSDARDGSRRNESFEKGSKGGIPKRTSLNSAGSRHTAGGSAVGGFGVGVLGGEGAGSSGGAAGGSFSEEQLLTSTYSPLSPRSREYMTLSAYMNIQDVDPDSPRSSLRKKPEVALVTSDVDLNFTVNHAYTRSRQASEMSSERGLGLAEEIDFPQASTVEIPTRTVEESIVYY